MSSTAELLIWSYLLLLNLTAFAAFWVDKRRARKGKYRIPERRLLLVAMLGGSIGAWLGMYLFRHKTKHLKFVIGVTVILLLYVGLFVYWKLIS